MTPIDNIFGKQQTTKQQPKEEARTSKEQSNNTREIHTHNT